MRKIVLMFLILGGAAAARAQGFDLSEIQTGNGFESLCSVVEKIGASNFQPTDKDVATIGYCTGYVTGLKTGVMVAMAVTSVTAPDSLQTIAFCTPEEATNGQLVKVILRYIRDNPDQSHLLTGMLATAAFHKAFPCPDSPGPTKKKK